MQNYTKLWGIILVSVHFVSFSHQIELCSVSKIQKNVKKVRFAVRKDLAIGAGLTGLSLYLAIVPLINLYNNISKDTKNELVEKKTFGEHIKLICSGIVNSVFSEEFFVSVGTAVCTGLTGWMVQRAAGRVCYADTVSDFGLIYAPWEQRKRIAQRYVAALQNQSLDPEKRSFYKNAFIKSMNCFVHDLEMLFAYIQYKVLSRAQDQDAILNNAIFLYLFGMVNKTISQLNELLDTENPDYASISAIIHTFCDEFKTELIQGCW